MATTETKKENFRKYLESAGVIDSLTKVLVALYEEPDKPPQGIEFLMTSLGAKTPDEFNAVVAEKDELAAKVEELTKQLEEATAKVAELSAGAEAPAEEGAE
eukprot:CAMPEP_0170142812 /NCGR_PEP_ID=MMETSP0033_2-20121228/8623_1 /TAXON_ID=195969 /ORGANISM="Dolichomastix tenuilepis, Strain CCMP3274" /LENGTH=101 /DNA_ID=CAMNT_0010379189 /DNA_START=12 /DNA_END=317 /DNA_ORIENTATION=+